MLKVGIIGVGTVGTSVANILIDNKNIISARAGKEIVPTIGVVSNLGKKRDVSIKLTTNADEILEDDSIDIVVELMGGIDKPYEIVKKALLKGKAVVTANKALLAYHRYELQELAGDIPFEFEAAVAGGIPIINALRDGLSANHIKSIQGIMNGTCNYMLTRMINDGVNYDEILKEAQELGYAEADPTFDVGGYDAAHKLLILGSIAYGIDVKPEEILIEGIENITKADIEFAKEFEYSIKLLGIAKKVGNEIELRVHPVLIPEDKMIAKVDGVMNGISVVGDKVGETMYYGAGAGGDATASAVVANIIDIARKGKGSPMLGFEKQPGEKITLMPKENIQTKYYLRLEVADKSGTLAKVATIFGNNSISIENMMQKPLKDSKANLLLTTHTCVEKDILKAIKELENSGVVLTKPNMIRIED
ncbi:homoserine dehydrogenase [Aliarcobacter butzleri]|uniref:Homoserine dehydrogenase n=1 Tax=Aliarcobacter butzleri L351 TaxID=1447259 RepID=A0A837J8P4_9BACT|nr:homoserine dehydrogenase [Aliarcobacter butzleri]KLE02787.1 homoserine dehydrogenase [Aliarcobacter butzleri L351]KLE14030.1 homoserine dehydrogenase [Aliarcobacter butzleri L350]MDN5047211.1 homoserine dehydrogenase [Aliarcobacter butzleri]MDN5058514.1 homoserine dehydrogenase [Aliarcobacter butzleri]MDN5109312.1 homoserine dehydrogenase [Aliarcobacter butzleri]